MSTQLESRVTAWVADHPGSTVEEIARAVRGRTTTVRTVLQSPLFSFAPRAAYAADKALTYSLRSYARDGRGRVDNRLSQSQRLMEILADGRWHSSASLHASVFCVLHSRIAELRRRGHIVECRHVGGTGPSAYEYRLIRQCDVREVAA